MLGPLKFGIQKTQLAVPMTAVAPARFSLTLSIEGGSVNEFDLMGPAGATAFINWGNGTTTPITLTKNIYEIRNKTCASTVTIAGSNLITTLKIKCSDSIKLSRISGTYPTSLNTLYVGFNYENPEFTAPNIAMLGFYNSSGPSILITGSNLISLDLPPNLTTLNLSASTNLTTLNVSGCAGLTSLTVPPKVTTLDISKCTGITTVALPPVLTTLRIDRSGLTSLDLTGTNVTTLNIPPSMNSQLRTLKVAGSKLKLSGLVNFAVPENSNWSLY